MQLKRASSTDASGIWLTDALGASYRFVAHPIDASVEAENAVYAYAHHDGSDWVLHYISRADLLRRKLARDPNRDPARWAGATHLLVHVPAVDAEIKHSEAEVRLVHAYNPRMNRNYRTRYERIARE